jgi:tRNA (adenine57-N1/adenine58-N1)-methyltransferase catalytic subunit
MLETSDNYARVGDLVLIYFNVATLLPIQLKKDGDFHTRYGYFRHADIIGREYGTKIYARSEKQARAIVNGPPRYAYLLRITPELWTASLPLRTQILYTVDISMILMHLYVKPGYVVIESGTGSGSLTTSFARGVAPDGHVYTYEFHAERVKQARLDFESLGISHLVTVSHADACSDGFDLHSKHQKLADAVFLDLPQPWLALKFAIANLKTNGRICSFSPCIEQVQHTAKDLSELGFDDILTIETLYRPFEVELKRTLGNSVSLYPELFVKPKVDQVVVRAHPEKKVKIETNEDEEVLFDSTRIEEEKELEEDEDGKEEEEVLKVEEKVEDELKPAEQPSPIETETLTPEPPKAIVSTPTAPIHRCIPYPPVKEETIPFVPSKGIRGHTGYLTFATMYSKEKRRDVLKTDKDL